MDLTQSQKDALLDLGECALGHEFISTKVLNQLLALDLVYWRMPNDLVFTSAGEQVYNELTGTTEAVVETL